MKIMDVLMKHGKVTQEQYDAGIAKETAKQAVRENYKANRAKLTKPQLVEILDKLVE